MSHPTDWLPHINRTLCIGCQECITYCPTGALTRKDDKAALTHSHLCTYCSACEDVCPAGAIELPFLIIKRHP